MAATGSGAGSDPGDRRRLERPPSDRYGRGEAAPGAAAPGAAEGGAAWSALVGPLLRAAIVGVVGAGALYVVGALLASTAGLLFTAGVTGAGIGIVLARAAAPRGGLRPVARRNVAWLAIALAIAAVVVASIATWITARGEGGTLGLVDYLLETFGPFVPGEAIVAALAAAWGANAGPVQA
jgi:hypothetical protein